MTLARLPVRYRAALRSRAVGQSIGYIGSNIVVLGASAVTSTILARKMTVIQFGAYSTVTSLLIFLALFFEFGLFVPASRDAARTTPSEARRILGASLIAFIPLAVAFVALVFGLSFFVDGWFNLDVGHALRVVAPLTVVFPLQFVASQMAQGMDRLHVFSLASAAGSIAFALALAAALVAGSSFSLVGVLVVLMITTLVPELWLFSRLRPRLGRGLGPRLVSLLREARSYGFEVYLGRVLAIATYRVDVLMVAALAGARSVAFYSLAGSIATIVSLPGVALGAALFPSMTKMRSIPREWLLVTWLAAVAGSVAAAAVGRPLVVAVFSSRYRSVADLLVPLAMAEGLRSVTSLYTSFQAAHGRGKALRKAATVLTASNLVFNVGLIPAFGAIGAAWASFLALLLNLLAHMTYYRRSLSSAGDTVADEMAPPAARE